MGRTPRPKSRVRQATFFFQYSTEVIEFCAEDDIWTYLQCMLRHMLPNMIFPSITRNNLDLDSNKCNTLQDGFSTRVPTPSAVRTLRARLLE